MTAEHYLIEWHDLEGYARGVVDGRDKYLIQPVAFEGFHGYELLKPTSDGDLQLGYFKRVSLAKQVAEDKEAARVERRAERASAAVEPDEGLFDQIRPRDRVTIVDRFGKHRTGRVVMRGPAGWVLNMGGPHGTPAIATPENVVSVRSSREAGEAGAAEESRPWPRPRTRGAQEDAGPHGALDWRQEGEAWIADTFGGAQYRLQPDDDGFQAWYDGDGRQEDLGHYGTLGGAMGAARRHEPAGSRSGSHRAAEGESTGRQVAPVRGEWPSGVLAHWHTFKRHQLPTEWQLKQLRWKHTLYRVDAWVGRNQPEGSPKPSIYAVDAKSPKEAENIVVEQWLRHKYVGDWEFEAVVKPWPVKDGVPERIADSEFSFLDGEASERVPVVHEAELPAAKVSEDFTSVGSAEQHAYSEGFRFIAPKSKRQFYIYRRRAVGKKGYERRVLYFRRGKWHVSADRSTVSRLRGDSAPIKVSQSQRTVEREKKAPLTSPEGDVPEEAYVAADKLGASYILPHGAGFYIYVPRGRHKSATADREREAAKGFDRYELHMKDDSWQVVGDGVHVSELPREPGGEWPLAKPVSPRHAVEEDHLTASQRARLPNSAFAMPKERKLPINDRKHVRNAAARLSMMLNDGSITMAQYKAAHKRIERAGKRLRVSVSAAEEATKHMHLDGAEVHDQASVPTEEHPVSIVERSPGVMPTGIRVESPEDVWKLMSPRYAKLGSEMFCVLLVSNQGELIGNPIEVAKGQPDRVAVDIEQVVAVAITGASAGARGFIVCHGHPSGGEFSRPSRADRNLTESIKKSAAIACPSTAFIDHVVIAPVNKSGAGSYYSFEEGRMTKVTAPN